MTTEKQKPVPYRHTFIVPLDEEGRKWLKLAHKYANTSRYQLVTRGRKGKNNPNPEPSPQGGGYPLDKATRADLYVNDKWLSNKDYEINQREYNLNNLADKLAGREKVLAGMLAEIAQRTQPQPQRPALTLDPTNLRRMAYLIDELEAEAQKLTKDSPMPIKVTV